MTLPIAFNEQLRSLLAEASVSVRANLKKMPGGWGGGGVACVLVSCRAVSGERPLLTLDPLLHGGYYVQEASSMFVWAALRQCVGEEPVVMLDLCAAPGGKSTLACDALPDGSLLVANEVMRQRAQVLAENLTK